MVDSPIRKQSNFIESLIDEFFLAPVDVPVVVLGLFVSSPKHGLLNAVGEKCFELDVATD